MRGNRFDGDQLVVQQKLATKVFEASHIAPAREVVVCEEVRVSLNNELQARVELPLVLKHLPEVRCKAFGSLTTHQATGRRQRARVTPVRATRGPTGRARWRGCAKVIMSALKVSPGPPRPNRTQPNPAQPKPTQPVAPQPNSA